MKVGVVGLAMEPTAEPLSGVARCGLIDVDIDRGKVNAEGEARDEGKWMSK